MTTMSSFFYVQVMLLKPLVHGGVPLFQLDVLTVPAASDGANATETTSAFALPS